MNINTPGVDLRQYTETRIDGLKATMEAFFRSWKSKSKTGILPSRVVFFRDSIDFEDKNIEDECRDIETAYMKVSGAIYSPELTYIVVNKNNKLRYETTSSEVTEQMTPVEDYLTDSEYGSKYCYYALRKDKSQMKPLDLPKLTRYLNESSQLTANNEPTAIALPLIFASKLSELVHDYFRFHENVKTKTDPVFKIDPVKRQEGYVSRHIKAEGKAVDKVNALLAVDEDQSSMGPWKKSLDGTMFYL